MYSIPALKSKYPVLVEKLNHLLKASDFSTLDLVRVKKEAKEIKEHVDLASGFSLLGMISCLEKNEMKMRSFFKRAIQQSSGGLSHILNYAVSLKNLGFLEEAYDFAIEAHDQNPLSLECIDFTIEIACILNKKAEFEKLATRWRKLNKEPHTLELSPRIIRPDEKGVSDFIQKHSKPNYELPSGHLYPEKIVLECGLEMIRIFGAPLNVVIEIMLDPDAKPNMVAWIQCFGDFDEGMRLYDQFEQWYIDHDYDLKTDIVSFNIEFVEA